jgi:hypothetical protein
MPVRVSCECGQILNAPDSLAGKAVKCPKCQKAIRVPAAGTSTGSPTKSAPAAGAAVPSGVPTTQSAPGKSATAKSAATTSNAPATAAKPTAAKPKAAAPSSAGAKSSSGVDALANLFDQAGLTKREGVFCPSCDKSLPPGTSICVSCGFHLEQGSKVDGFQVEVKEFGDKRLVEAAEMMKREAETEKRLLGAGTPWWMLLAIVAGLLFMITAVLLKMDVKASGNVSTVPLIAKLQRANLGPVLAFSLGGGSALIALFAYLAIALGAFKESAKQGLLNLFAPFYIFYYMFSRMQARRLFSTVVIFWVSAVVAGICLGYSLPKI